MFRKIVVIGILAGSAVSAKVSTSVYSGVGLGTNLGGTVGVGTELKYGKVALHGAVGSWVGRFPEHTGDRSRFDYDVGIKLYIKYGFFGGVNYGLIDASLSTRDGQDIHDFNKIRGFSFAAGYRKYLYRNIFGTAYMGITSNEKVNYLTFFKHHYFIPRMGILIGYTPFSGK